MAGFVINLDHDHERLQLFQKRLQPKMFNIQRFPAIEGKEYRMRTTSNDMSFYAKNFATNKTIGCSKSHFTLWQKVVDLELPYAVIFEDDAVPIHPNNWENEIQQVISKMSGEHWDIILIGNTLQYFAKHSDQNPLIFSFLNLMGYGRKSHVVKDGIISPVHFCGAYAYIVSQSGARKLLKECSVIDRTPIDLRLSSLHKQHKIVVVACVNPIISAYGADDNNFFMWIMNDGLFRIGETEVKCCHFCILIFITFMLWVYSRYAIFLFLFFMFILCWLFLLYPDCQ